MPKDDATIDEIKTLEERRYRAMLAGDTVVLDELCSDDLIYTHSKADFDDKPSYLHKVGSRYFTYLEITHPADRILLVDSAALVTGRMTARVSVAGTIVHVDNRYLAVWVREHGAWVSRHDIVPTARNAAPAPIPMYRLACRLFTNR